VAKKKKRKIGWLKKLLFFIFTPFIIWLLAFAIWFYWNDTKSSTANKGKTQTTPKATRQAEPPAKQSADEKILDEDREKLEEILKTK
jgi:hypothetical protein